MRPRILSAKHPLSFLSLSFFGRRLQSRQSSWEGRFSRQMETRTVLLKYTMQSLLNIPRYAFSGKVLNWLFFLYIMLYTLCDVHLAHKYAIVSRWVSRKRQKLDSSTGYLKYFSVKLHLSVQLRHKLRFFHRDQRLCKYIEIKITAKNGPVSKLVERYAAEARREPFETRPM